MRVLGIETSCDETGVALYETGRGLSPTRCIRRWPCIGRSVAWCPSLRRATTSSACCRCCAQVLDDAGIGIADIDAIAYTQGPGLAGALLVGASIAQRARLCARQARDRRPSPRRPSAVAACSASPAPSFPFVALLVSGGHTQFFEVAAVGRYRLLGDTLDDAAGEAFDKTAHLLGLPYPGGPALAALAEAGRPGAVVLPRPMLDSGNLDVSFSGLKTAVALKARAAASDGGDPASLSDARKADIAHAFQAAVVDVLVAKSMQALGEPASTLVVAGGVGANRALRAAPGRCGRAARRSRVLSRAEILHGQRRDDRDGGRAAHRVRVDRPCVLGASALAAAVAARTHWPIGRSRPDSNCRMLTRWRQNSSNAMATLAHA